MLQNSSEFNSLGGGFAGGFPGFGGYGGIAPFGLFGLASLGHQGHAHGGHGGHDGCARDMVMLNAIGNLKDTVGNAKDAISSNVQTSKDALASSIERSKDSLDNSIDRAKDILGLALNRVQDDICETKSKLLETKYDLAALNVANTQSIKDQTTAFQIANDRKFDDLSREADRNTALILAKINQTEIDRLRDELEMNRRRSDARDVEITMIQNQNQQQQQQQLANFDIHRKFDILFAQNQLNRTSNETFNWGVMAASGNQATQATNIK